MLLIHISNSFMWLEPAIAALAKQRGLYALQLAGEPISASRTIASHWGVLARDRATLHTLRAASGDTRWKPLMQPLGPAWTADHASILPNMLWDKLLVL